jgi:hypothetical protein
MQLPFTKRSPVNVAAFAGAIFRLRLNFPQIDHQIERLRGQVCHSVNQPIPEYEDYRRN